MVFDVALTYSQDDYELKGSFEPQSSALYAFYPVEGRAELKKVYPGQLVNTRRSLTFKRIELKIKDQQRIIQNEAECNLQAPIKLCESILWPASSPLEIRAVIPIMATENPGKDEDDDSEDDEDDGDDINNPILEYISRFNFYTRPWPEPCQKQLSCYAMFLSWALPDNSEKSIESEYGIPFISQLPPMTVFKAEDVLESKLEPSQPQTIPEGMEVEFKAALTPRPDLGEGILSKESQDTAKFNVLDGYKVKALPDIVWFEDPDWIDNTNWNSNPVAAAFSHIFKPTHGIGSYTLRCRFNFELEESETKDSSKVVIENEVPVSAIPGLRLLSPINKLAYPLDQTIKVTTTMDSQDEWDDITWKLNGEKFDPPGEDPGFPLLLDKAGKWSIEARLETINPNTGKLIPLISSATFEVKPLNIAITPAKQVSKFVQGLKLPVEVVAKFDNSIVEAPGKEFYWADKTKAIIDPVQWAAVSVPENCADLDSDPQSFKAECEFNAAGAATVLATVTLRIVGAEALFKKAHKGFKDKFEEQVFEFTVTRADLWAVTVGEIRNLKGIFPEKAVTGIERTFKVNSFDIDIFNTKYSYNSQFASTSISLEPALSGENPVKSTSVSFKWFAKEDDEESAKNENVFKFIPEKDGNYQVSFIPYLKFDSNDELSLGEKKLPLLSVPFDSLVFGSVDPASFTLNLGDTQKLSCKVWSYDTSQPPPTNAKDQPLTILNGAYEVYILKVEWTENANSSKQLVEASTYNFVAKIPGITKGAAIVYFAVSETIGDQKMFVKGDLQKRFEFLAQVKGPEVEILANGKPINDQEFYQGQRVNLTYKVSLPDQEMGLRSVKWSFEGELPLSKIETKSDDLSNGDYLLYAYKVLPLKEEELEHQELEILLFDYNPDKNVVVGTFSYAIANEQPREKGFVIPYSKILVEGFKPKNSLDDIQIFEVTSGTWAIGFPITNDPTPGAFEAEAAFNNKTSIWHIVGGFQLVRIDATRSFVDSEDHVRKQFLKSINESADFSTEAEFWLDKWYPAQTMYFNELVLPHDKTTFFKVIQDNPRLPLEKELSFDGVKYQAATFTVEIIFHTFLFAKPKDDDYSFESFIIPLQTYESSWKATAYFDKKTDKWSKLDDNIRRFEKIDLPILEWKNLAIGKGTEPDPSPDWRDLEK